MSSDPRENPKPAFSAYLRRLDPLLAAEDTNALYQAFRARRMARTSGIRHSKSVRMFRLVAVVLLIIGVSGCIATLVPWFWLRALIVLGGIAAPIAFVWLQPRSASARHLPHRLSEVFFDIPGPKREAARDVWMTPASPRDVVEALYLEACEGVWGINVAAHVAVGMVGVVMYAMVREEVFTVRATLLLAAFVWFLREFADLSFESSTQRLVLVAGGAVNRFARATALPRTASTLARGVGLAVVLVVAVTTVGAVAFKVLEWTRWNFFLEQAVLHKGSEWYGAFLFCILAWAIRRRSSGRNAARSRAMLDRIARRAERYYPLYMSLVVFQDPDARAWADAQFGDAEAFEKTMDQEFPTKTIFGVIKLG